MHIAPRDDRVEVRWSMGDCSPRDAPRRTSRCPAKPQPGGVGVQITGNSLIELTTLQEWESQPHDVDQTLCFQSTGEERKMNKTALKNKTVYAGPVCVVSMSSHRQRQRAPTLERLNKLISSGEKTILLD